VARASTVTAHQLVALSDFRHHDSPRFQDEGYQLSLPTQRPGGASPILPRRVSYALVGAGLAQGAAAGLVLIRAIARGHHSIRSLRREIADDLPTYAYIAISTTVVFSAFGALLGRQADRLAQLATTDPLTELFNRRAFRRRFHEEIARAARYHQPLSLLVLDVDGLKNINDDYGHEAGDNTLRLIAAAIRHGLREPDVAARVGGDEFTVLAPNTDQASAVVLGERLRALVTERNAGEMQPRATVSIGIATFAASSDETSDELSLMRAADAALYQAKRGGGNRVLCGLPPAV